MGRTKTMTSATCCSSRWPTSRRAENGRPNTSSTWDHRLLFGGRARPVCRVGISRSQISLANGSITTMRLPSGVIRICLPPPRHDFQKMEWKFRSTEDTGLSALGLSRGASSDHDLGCRLARREHDHAPCPRTSGGGSCFHASWQMPLNPERTTAAATIQSSGRTWAVFPATVPSSPGARRLGVFQLLSSGAMQLGRHDGAHSADVV